MSYISTCTSEILHYHEFSEQAKKDYHFRMTGKHYTDMPDWFKEVFVKLSLNVKKYVDAETRVEKDKIWFSYDKLSQYMCDQDKYDDYYKGQD
jgi:hypothetical protein